MTNFFYRPPHPVLFRGAFFYFQLRVAPSPSPVPVRADRTGEKVHTLEGCALLLLGEDHAGTWSGSPCPCLLSVWVWLLSDHAGEWLTLSPCVLVFIYPLCRQQNDTNRTPRRSPREQGSGSELFGVQGVHPLQVVECCARGRTRSVLASI